MESRSDIVIVSAFGRGVWLALELAQVKTNQVTFIDVSDRLGHSQPEDWNGPFPLLKTSQFSEAQWNFLAEGSHLEPIENGYTFWLANGPWEITGPLFDFIRQKNQIHPDVVKYLKEYHTMTEANRKLLQTKIEKMTGKENWLAYFAQQLTSSVYISDRIALEPTIPLAMFSPCYIRQANEATTEVMYKKLREAGVRLYLNAKLEDLSVQSRVLDGIEIASERSGIVTGKKFVWMLTGEETRRFTSRVLETLFGDGIVEASWCWVRFLIRIADGPERDVLPGAFTMAKDIHLPWTHANVCLVERTKRPGIFRTWMRVAAGRRFQRSYMTEMSNDLVAEFRKRIPAIAVEVEEMPPEFHFGFEELGPPRYPVLSKQDARRISRTKIKNVYHMGPEDWGGLDWGTRMSVENRTFFTLLTENSNKKPEELKSDNSLYPS